MVIKIDVKKCNPNIFEIGLWRWWSPESLKSGDDRLYFKNTSLEPISKDTGHIWFSPILIGLKTKSWEWFKSTVIPCLIEPFKERPKEAKREAFDESWDLLPEKLQDKDNQLVLNEIWPQFIVWEMIHVSELTLSALPFGGCGIR